MAERIITWQSIQDYWQQQVLPEDQLEPKGRFNRAMEEVEEAKAEMATFDGSPESVKRLGSEIADYIFASVGVLGVLGIDLEAEFIRIMDQNHRKYNIVENGKLRASGMTCNEALAHQKRVYSSGNGNGKG